jgi:hypothetical protein
MSDATGTVTTNYGFKTLDDGDRAGYTGINEIVTSIDTNLANDTFVADMIVLYPGSTPPAGWVDFNTTITGLQASMAVTGYIWIKKS